MVLYQKKPKRAKTGGFRRQVTDKKLAHMGGIFAATKVAPESSYRTERARGGSKKIKLKGVQFANISTPDGVKKSKIVTVKETKDNKNYSRMNIITKGAIIQTELGMAKVTNRPGKDGVVNALLVK